jgi:hypothetical protein
MERHSAQHERRKNAEQATNLQAAKLFVAGGISGGVARVCGSPFSRITIMLQTQTLYTDAEGMKAPIKIACRTSQWRCMAAVAQTLWRTEGFRGFFRGNGVDVLRTIPATGLGYVSYEYFKDYLTKSGLFDPQSKSAHVVVRLIAGGFSGLTSVLATYPLDLLRTRMCVSAKYTGNIAAMTQQIVRQEGLGSLYRGASVACLGIVPNLAINFSMFEMTRNFLEDQFGRSSTSDHRRLSNNHPREHTMWISLVSGIGSGLVSLTATFPIDLVQRRMMLQGMQGQDRVYTGMWDCLRTVVRHEGWTGLYNGLLPQALRSLPFCAVSFAVYDQLKRWFHLEVDPT